MEERLTHHRKKNLLHSHDGIHDSQTHLASPSYFYEQLMREIAHSERSGENFSLIRILFMKRNELNETSINEVDAADILYFSQALLDVTRKQDCVARMGINECVILIRDNKCNVQNVLSRLQSSSDLTVEKTLSISIASTQFEHGENSLELLHRLDSSALSTH